MKPTFSFPTDKKYLAEEVHRSVKIGYSYTEQSLVASGYMDTYREIKKHLKKMLELSNGAVSIVRTRRGEWGQWFEQWELVDGKPKITKKTWL